VKPARQLAIRVFRETYIDRGMPQSFDDELDACSYRHPVLMDHGCAIGILPGFADLPESIIDFNGSVDELISKSPRFVAFLSQLGFDVTDAHRNKEVGSDAWFLSALQELHDAGEIDYYSPGGNWDDGSFIPARLEAFIKTWEARGE
jgi:hypothetical protein